jgi:diguanylate cyclase (GGDEF)-like protein
MMPAWSNGHHEPRVLVVNDPGRIADLVRRRYPTAEVQERTSYLAGISACGPASGPPVRRVLVGVDPTSSRLRAAVQGLRRAVGGDGRIILCCRPEGEPAARATLDAGADDYIIYPPTGHDLDTALAIPQVAPAPAAPPDAAADVSPAELERLATLLSELTRDRPGLMQQAAALVQEAIGCTGVTLVVEDQTASAGPPIAAPVFTEPIRSGNRHIGHIRVGPRAAGPYAAEHLQKLRHYATLIGYLIDAADRCASFERLALTDELTGLPNRRQFLQMLDEKVRRATADRTTVTLLIFDIDDFKHYNDRFGHAAGDEILRETGQLFRQCSRQHDLVARLGGDEFAVVFWQAEQPRVAGSKHPTDVLQILRRFRKELGTHRFPSLGPEAEGVLTISGGLASFPWDGGRAADLIQAADQALLRAKRDGKNRICLVGDTPDDAEREGLSPHPFEPAATSAPPAAPDQEPTTRLRIERMTNPHGALPATDPDIEWCLRLVAHPAVRWRAVQHSAARATTWFRDHREDAAERIALVVNVTPCACGCGLAFTAPSAPHDDREPLATAMADALLEYVMETQLDDRCRTAGRLRLMIDPDHP